MANLTTKVNGGVDKVRDFLANTNDTTADYPFYTGKCAVVFDGTWIFGHMATTAPDMYKDSTKWGVALRPYNGNNAKATHHGTSGLAWAWGYVIPKGLPQEVQDAAYEWVEWWIAGGDPKGKDGCYFLFQQSQVSAVQKCMADQSWYDVNPYWDTVLEALKTDVSIPITPVQSEITSILGDAVEQALYGQMSAKDALDSAAKQGQAVLDKFWSKA